ncbi:MAG: potassium transporter TrkA [Bacteroidetes bacterium]|nr:MAG: potassium transporter TrkA [Bacteroidota bacterium]
MSTFAETIVYILSFAIIVVSSNQISKLFLKIKLPLITGFLFIGILTGPYVLNFVPQKAIKSLNFVNDISLSFIAFAAGAELYLREFRSRRKSIKWMTIGQLFFTFVLGGAGMFLLTDVIQFTNGMSVESRLAVSILTGIIFVARSPVSAIAIINEQRASGPFTQTTIGVTVLTDVLIIILFSIGLSISQYLISGIDFSFNTILILMAELSVSLFVGYLLGRLLVLILSIQVTTDVKIFMILFSGYSIFILAKFVKVYTNNLFSYEFYIEPLLICIIGSFYVTNFSKFRREFLKIVSKVTPIIYLIFFTLTGLSVSLDVIITSWAIAIVLLFLRIFSMIIGSFVGGVLAGDSMRFNKVGWMSYITQAGVAIGLLTVVEETFPDWGTNLATILLTVIVINQFIGPPMLKWVLNYVGETHLHASGIDGKQRVVIFGLENQSYALAQQLKRNNWQVSIVTLRTNFDSDNYSDVKIQTINNFSLNELSNCGADKASTIVALKTDEENYEICKLAYDKFGTKSIVVRVNNYYNYNRFQELGAIVVCPSTAIIRLLDHYVRSPQATSLLLGEGDNKDTVDIEIKNKDIHGITLRNLRIPSDIIILSTKRKGQMIISTGYTRIRYGDILTVVGSIKSINELRLRFEGE